LTNRRFVNANRLVRLAQGKGAWRLVLSSGSLIPIDASTPEDPDIAKLLQACK
jgi:hypothetical protein